MQKLKPIFLSLSFLLFSAMAMAQTEIPVAKDSVYTQAEQMPVFRKGTFEEYLIRNLEYPQDAIDRKIQGKVFVTFIVDEDGKVQDAKVLKGIGYGCDEEALDLINATSGKWNPGITGGKKVKVRMNVPIVFKIGMPKGK